MRCSNEIGKRAIRRIAIHDDQRRKGREFIDGYEFRQWIIVQLTHMRQTEFEGEMISKAFPSGAACAAHSAPISVPAPGRLLTTIAGPPSTDLLRQQTRHDVGRMPGGNGRVSRIVRSAWNDAAENRAHQ